MTKASVTQLVERRGQQAVTTSEAIATGCHVQHKNVMATVRRYLGEFEEFGKVAFETRLNPQGSPTELAILNEDQATYLITLLRNNETVRAFKRKLVHAFRSALNEIARLYANPPRRDILTDKRRSGALMCDVFKELRDEAGKDTKPFHYGTEYKLCNWVLTGEFKPLDESSLSNADADLLRKIRARNTSLIEAEIDYPERKARLAQYAIRQRTKLIAPAPGDQAL